MAQASPFIAEVEQECRPEPPCTYGETPVLVLADTRLALHHGTLGVIRTLGRLGVPVFAVVGDRFTPAAVSRYLTGAFVWRTPHLTDKDFLTGMRMIARRLGRPAVVIPTSDVSAMLLAENAAELKPWFVFPPLPAGLPRAVANKQTLFWLCRKNGIPCPESFFPKSLADVHRFVRGTSFPVVVKGAAAWHLPTGVYTTTIVSDAEELHRAYGRMADGRGGNVLFQEYIGAEHGADWFYHGYRSATGGFTIGFTGQKLRSYPPFAGPTTLGKSVANDVLRAQAESLLERLEYAGIVDLDYRFDRRDGQYKLTDFNPRIGAQFRLFENGLGIDVARALYLDLCGCRVRKGRAEPRTFVADAHDLAAALQYLRRGVLTLGAWRDSLRGKKEWAWFCLDDPIPLPLVYLRMGLRAMTRKLPAKQNASPSAAAPRFFHGLGRWFSRRARPLDGYGR